MSTLDMPDFFDKTYFSEDCTCDTHGQKAPPSGIETKHQTDNHILPPHVLLLTLRDETW